MLYKMIENIKNNFIENIESYREDNNNNNNYPSFIYILKKEIEIIKGQYNKHKTLVIGLFVIFILVLITDLNTVSSISLRTVANQCGGVLVPKLTKEQEKKRKTKKEENKIKKKADKKGISVEDYKKGKEEKDKANAKKKTATDSKFDQKIQDKKQAYKQRESTRIPKEQRDAERKERLGAATASAFGGPGFFNKIKFHLLRGASAIGIILLIVGVVVVPIILYAIVLFMVLKSNVTTLTTKL